MGTRKICAGCTDVAPKDSLEAQQYVEKLNELGRSNSADDGSMEDN